MKQVCMYVCTVGKGKRFISTHGLDSSVYLHVLASQGRHLGQGCSVFLDDKTDLVRLKSSRSVLLHHHEPHTWYCMLQGLKTNYTRSLLTYTNSTFTKKNDNNNNNNTIRYLCVIPLQSITLHTHIHIHTHTHARTHTHLTHTCTHTYTHAHAHTHTHAHTYICS